MKKLKLYLLILAIALIIIAAGYLMNIGMIKSICRHVITFADSQILSVTAAVCAFLFYGAKNYWLAILGCAIATALVIQFLIIGGGAELFVIAVRTLAFVVIVYLMNLVKVIFNEFA